EGDAERVTAYERTPPEEGEVDGGVDAADGDPLLVVVNFADEPATVAVPEEVEADLFGDGSAAERDGDGEARVAVDAVAVLR
ncbi:hypothetical protein DJ68_12435, partial [Halorubrum sp. C3]